MRRAGKRDEETKREATRFVYVCDHARAVEYASPNWEEA